MFRIILKLCGERITCAECGNRKEGVLIQLPDGMLNLCLHHLTMFLRATIAEQKKLAQQARNGAMNPSYAIHENRSMYRTFEEQLAEFQEKLRSLPRGEKFIREDNDEEGNCLAR